MTTLAAAGSDVDAIDEASVTGDVEGAAVDVSLYAAGCFEFEWEGAGIATWSLERSGCFHPTANPDAPFSDLDVSIGSPDGESSNSSVDLMPPGGVFPYRFLKPILTLASGTLTNVKAKFHGVPRR